MLLLWLVIIAAVVLAALVKRIYSHWDRLGLPNLPPEIPYGNVRSVAERKESFSVAVNKLYHKSVHPLVGVYLFFKPAILIRDAHLAKRIMTSDFQYFHDRGVYHDEEHDPLSANMFTLPGQQWKTLRGKLTPTFSSGKLKHMMPTLMNTGDKLIDHMKLQLEHTTEIEMRGIVLQFVTEFIVSVFFGYEINCIGDPNHEFLRTLLEFNDPNKLINNLRTAGMFLCPDLLKLTRIGFLSSQAKRFVTDIVTDQIANREDKKIIRKDFMQLLIDLRTEDASAEPLTIKQCAANVFLFYIAGAETTTGSITFTLHELTHNPVIMKKLQQEIDETIALTDGSVTYEVLQQMQYLDLCVKETLRKYPALAMLNRECTRDYHVPHTDYTIRKGTQVIIPLLAISMDERYFPQPEKYLPERFDDRTKNYDEDAYYPFGLGPRNCIGFRQGLLVAKLALVLLLSNFEFISMRSYNVNFQTTSVALVPIGGFPCKVRRRNFR